MLAALVHPFFLAELLYRIFVGDIRGLFAPLPAVTIAAGYIASGFLGLLGLQRRGLLRSGWVLLTIPAHWLLLSLAAWRALYQLARDPYRWEKTEHGLAKTSRLAEAAPSPKPNAASAAAGSSQMPSAPRIDTFRRTSLDFPSRTRASD